MQLSPLARVYHVCYKDPAYGLQGARLARVTHDVESIPAGATYLDVACGRGEMVQLARERGVVAQGLEFVPALCGGAVLYADLLTIPFGDRSTDYVSCYDAVEHLEPETVDRALDELFRVTRRVLFLTTNDKRSVHKGVELHLTREPRDWWEAKLAERAILRNAEIVPSTYGRDEWHWRIEFGDAD